MDQRLMLPPRREADSVVSTSLSLNACSLDRQPATHARVWSSVWLAHHLYGAFQIGDLWVAEVHHIGMASGVVEDGPDLLRHLEDMMLLILWIRHEELNVHH